MLDVFEVRNSLKELDSSIIEDPVSVSITVSVYITDVKCLFLRNWRVL